MSDDHEKFYADIGLDVPIKEIVKDPETGRSVAFFKLDGPAKAVYGEGDEYLIYGEAFAHHMIVEAEGRRFIVRVQDVVQAIRDRLRPEEAAA